MKIIINMENSSIPLNYNSQKSVEPYFTLVENDDNFVNICTSLDFDDECQKPVDLEKEVLVISRSDHSICSRPKSDTDFIGNNHL